MDAAVWISFYLGKCAEFKNLSVEIRDVVLSLLSEYKDWRVGERILAGDLYYELIDVEVDIVNESIEISQIAYNLDGSLVLPDCVMVEKSTVKFRNLFSSLILDVNYG
jgi:hypothetical protein